ncbi:protein TonB [Oxalobacteraceae bacterium GrIS 2.11]
MSEQQTENWQEEKPPKPYKAIIICVVALVVIAWGLHALMGTKSNTKQKQPKISLLAPPPPPPPPPPKFEKKIEPPKDAKEVKVDQPQPKNEPPAPAPELKMEGAAGDGPSAFGSGKITSDDLSKLGTGKGELGGVLNFNNYSFMLKSELQRYLNKQNSLRHRQYKVEVRVWLAGNGSVNKSELVSSTGDEDTDKEIRAALASVPNFTEAPPANMPQPIRIRIISTGRS